MSTTSITYLHREIYRARDQQFYTRAELPAGGLAHAGPFATPDEALAHLQQLYQVGEQFYFDDSGRRPAPAATAEPHRCHQVATPHTHII